jgi:Ran GTPase-activating protein (RanGAP) involved in mRNA processing and transport
MWRVLLLDGCVKQPGELAALLPACTGLRELNLSNSNCSFSADDRAALVGMSQLEKLQLQRCRPMLHDGVFASLVQLRQLQQLDLQDNDMSPVGTRALLVALAGASGKLKELRVGGNFEVTGCAKTQLTQEFAHVAP